MKSRFLLLILLALLASACSQVEERVVSALFTNYVSAQKALASDDYAGAKAAFTALAAEPEAAELKLQGIAKEISETADIEEARKKFQKLSKLMADLPLPEGYVVAFCPMVEDGKGASWVQSAGDIENPYYGSKMLNCGEITKTN